jgi:hypothetical protein
VWALKRDCRVAFSAPSRNCSDVSTPSTVTSKSMPPDNAWSSFQVCLFSCIYRGIRAPKAKESHGWLGVAEDQHGSAETVPFPGQLFVSAR